MASDVILCVDDDELFLRALQSLLADSLGPGVVVEGALSGADALALIDELHSGGDRVAVIIADYIMPGMKGDELLVRAHAQWPQMLKIMLTGQSDLFGVKRAINQAALYRFLEKPFDPDDFLLTIRGATDSWRQNRELERLYAKLAEHNARLEETVSQRTAQLREANVELERLSTTDLLTGLANRLKLDKALVEEFARAQRKQSPFSVILVDVDHFKHVNDTWGHHVGDRVLVEVARVLRDNVRPYDAVGRWGGEEFLVICADADIADAASVAEKLRAALEDNQIAETGPRTASFGVATCARYDDLASLLRRADAALYQAKRDGRNRVVVG